MKNEYVFGSVEPVVAHLKARLNNVTPLKLQKGLYFLWAFYSATYGNINYDNDAAEFESQKEYPEFLFPAKFEAWHYGPVIDEVYHKFKNKEYDHLKDNFIPNDQNEKEILSFMDDIIDQVNDINDFGLVERSHQDDAWADKFKEGEHHTCMSNEQIKQDYVRYLRNDSAI